MTSELALLGGEPVRIKKYPLHITTGEEEKRAAIGVLDKGILSFFEGTNNERFLGGEQVNLLEKEWANRFRVKFAVSFNSATSALYASIGACEIGPGDEVITTPFTMTATAASILGYNAIPVFSDVELKTYCLDPDVLEKNITAQTRAILVVHIFGHSADMDRIMALGRKYNLKIIEDAAQSPTTLYKGALVGTIGDIGIYSLNCNKHIQCGEGGIAVTNNEDLAERLRLIRNHAEAVIASGRKIKSIVNMLGWNYRMNEIEAAIAREQLKKLDSLIKARLKLVNYLNNRLKDIDGIILPTVKDYSTHGYYVYSLRIDVDKLGIRAPLFAKALNAEGIDFYRSFVKPLYLQPLYQHQILYGDKGCPFKCPLYKRKANYSRGICPNAERLEEMVISTEIVRPPQTESDMDEIVFAIKKVIENKEQLRKYNK